MNDDKDSSTGTSNDEQTPIPNSTALAVAVQNLLKVLTLSTSIAVVILGSLLLFETIQKRKLQIQNDPQVAAAWLAGVRYGTDCSLAPHHGLVSLMKRIGLRLPEAQHELLSRFKGANGSLEVWLGYVSHVAHQPQLVCEPVGTTAFYDNLGQSYRGFLDLQPGFVGIFLPGYDHAAKTITCVVHFVPSNSESAQASKPMRFVIHLPKVQRMLSTSASTGYSTVSSAHGITVKISHVRLSQALNGNYRHGQRELIFHLHINGGVVWARNMNMAEMENDTSIPAHQSVSIYDPYGMQLVLPHTFISRMRSFLTGAPFTVNHASVWVAPVSGAGESTNVVKIVLPVKVNHSANVVNFQMLVRVKQDLIV